MLITAESLTEMEKNLSEVGNRFKRHHVIINKEKTLLCEQKIKYLDHELSEYGLGIYDSF